ncbi:10004_t:CDS:2, partial [Racocetra fulgida]
REKFHQEQERKIKLAKFHEERGKEGCSCYDCKEKKEIRREVKQRYDAYWQEKEKPGEREEVENEYGECYENKMVSVESGLCRKCERELEKKA